MKQFSLVGAEEGTPGEALPLGLSTIKVDAKKIVRMAVGRIGSSQELFEIAAVNCPGGRNDDR